MSNRLSTRTQVMYDVDAERDRQDDKWGEQNHPDGTGERSLPLNRIVFHGPAVPANGDTHYANGLRNMATEATDRAARSGSVTWSDILLEEVFEALAESDPAKLRKELIQTAAVAAQWAEAIDRRDTALAEQREVVARFLGFEGYECLHHDAPGRFATDEVIRLREKLEAGS